MPSSSSHGKLMEFPSSVVFRPSQGILISVAEGTFAGSAMYQIFYEHIASINENNKIMGWRFLFEPAIQVVTQGDVQPSAGEHIHILVAESGKFEGFDSDKIFKCSKKNEMTNLLKKLLEENVKAFTDNDKNQELLTGLQKNPKNYQYIIVLGNNSMPYAMPTSNLGNQENPMTYKAYIEQIVARQQERRKQFLEQQERRKQFLEQQESRKQFLEQQQHEKLLEEQLSEKKLSEKKISKKRQSKELSKEEQKKKRTKFGGTKRRHKKSKRKTVSKKRQSKKRIV